MALRCTVFGHRWGEPDVEREREEDGDEVVVTVREIRTCGRCGTEDVLGESMEVTAIERNDPDPTDDQPEPSARPPERDDGDDETYDAETDDGVILDDEGDDDGERSPREWPGRPERDDQPEESGEPTPWPESARPDDEEPPEDRFVAPDERSRDDEDAPDDERSPEHDRGGAADRETPPGGEAGRTPDHSVGDPAGESDHVVEAGADDGDERDGIPRAEPDHGGGGDRDDAVSDRDGATGDDRDDDAGDGRDDDASGVPEEGTMDEPAAMGPDATQHPDDDAEVLDATEPNQQSRATAAEPVDPADHASGGTATGDQSRDVSLDPDEPPADETPAPENVEYYCPECGFVDDSEWPSRRAGDVCPDCRRSYLAEREH